MKEQQEQQQQQQQQIIPQQTNQPDQTADAEDRPRFVQIEQMGQAGQRLPIPEEVLTQLHRYEINLVIF